HNKTLSTSISCLAFIDNTTWITYTKAQMEMLLLTASSFYNFTNIQVNPTKSTLMTNSNDDNPHIIFNNIQINNIKAKSALRFLGYWFSKTKKHTPTHHIILNEVNSSLARLS